jgi:hypothetical protein
MSDLRRFFLRSDYRAQLVAMFPRVTSAQLMRFDDLRDTDRLVTDEGAPTEALQAWVKAVIGDEPPEAVLASLPPAPRPVPGACPGLETGSKALEVQG